MALFFQIIGVIVLAIIVVVLAIYLYIRIKLKGLTDSDSNTTPLVIHLNESYDSEWLKKTKARQISDSLQDLGFKSGKNYDVIGMPGVKLQAFFKQGTSAVMYVHPSVGHWVDMVYLGQEGEDVTVSNAVSGSEIDTRPECVKLHLTDASIQELWQRLNLETQEMSPSEINESNFRKFFETAYQKDMAFTVNKGGISRAEFMKVHHNNPVKISDENLERAFIETKVQEIEQWHSGVFSAHELEDYESDNIYFIVPETTDGRAFIQYLADYDVIPEEAVSPLSEKYQNRAAPDIFAEINKGFSEKLRATYITSVELPLKATVFSKPF